MANPRDPLLRHQAQLLRKVAGLGYTDDAVVAYCAGVGVSIDRSAIARAHLRCEITEARQALAELDAMLDARTLRSVR